MSGCFRVEENLNLGDFFQMLVPFTDYSSVFWYYFNFLLTSWTLLEIKVLISWLHYPRVLINSSSVTSEAQSYYFYLLGIMATNFLTQVLRSSEVFDYDID